MASSNIDLCILVVEVKLHNLVNIMVMATSLPGRRNNSGQHMGFVKLKVFLSKRNNRFYVDTLNFRIFFTFHFGEVEMNKIDFVKRGYGRLGLLLYTFSLFLSTFRWVILVSIGAI